MKEAKLQRDVDMVGKQDPFVELELGKWEWKSKVIQSGGKNPVWNETVEIPVEKFDKKLEIKVKDEDIGSSETVCEAKIEIGDFCKQASCEKAVPLEHKGKATGGEIHFSAEWKPKE